MSAASAQARATVTAAERRDEAIRDVAAGVAAPNIVGYVLWLLHDASHRGLRRLCFLSRDSQVFFEIAQRLAPRLGIDIDLRYVYSSRRTWSLAASDPNGLDKADWLFNSFIRSNAADVCARLGVDYERFTGLISEAGASLDPDIRADSPEQGEALRRFVAHPEVAAAMKPRIANMRELLRDYAVQEGIAEETSAMVDAGWTGRMVGSLYKILSEAKLPSPHTYFWGHEPRATGWTDPGLISPYMYHTAGEPGAQWRVPDAPFIMETFCMSDHAIVSGYHRSADGTVEATLERDNAPVTAWGLELYRSTLYAFCDSLALGNASDDVRPALSSVLHKFWRTPSVDEATAWGEYPYDSDPLGRAIMSLAFPIPAEKLEAALDGDAELVRGNSAWLPGALMISGELGQQVLSRYSEQFDHQGSPARD